MGTYMATLSRARWARAGDEEREELQRLIAIRTGPIIKELVANGLAKWGGRSSVFKHPQRSLRMFANATSFNQPLHAPWYHDEESDSA